MVKVRQSLGKYRIQRRIAEGGFATVYQARDTIEGIDVALKIPHAELLTPQLLADFRKEVRLTAGLDHPGILPIKSAAFIDELFVIAYPLGQSTLADRLQHRLSGKRALDYAEQILEAVAYAHRRRVIHLDIKPENLILFPEGKVRLTDFGIAKLALRAHTMTGYGTGTIGYLAPEQAFGRPSTASDVFALGLLFYRMFSGELPDWPYDWPPAGYDRLRRAVHPDFAAVIRRAMEVDSQRRFSDAGRMLAAFRRIKPRALRGDSTKKRRKTARRPRAGQWRTIRLREFKRRFGSAIGAHNHCGRCGGPVAEAMRWCPWCGKERRVHRGPVTRFPARCKRCGRGIKRDWKFCAWCYGGQIQEPSTREYDDARYEAKCRSTKCPRRDLMPFMRYCPWCHTKVTRRWRLPEGDVACKSCGWGVLPEYWDYCPWCGKRAGQRGGRVIGR